MTEGYAESKVKGLPGRPRRAITAAAVAAAILAAQAAQAGYAQAQAAATQDAPPPCPSCPTPPPPCATCPPSPSDTTRPTVVATVPTTGTVGVDRDRNIVVRFSEAMRAATVGGQTVKLYRGNLSYDRLNPPAGTDLPRPISATVGYDATRKLAILNPSARLVANARYTAVVEGAVDGDRFGAVRDKAGNALARDFIFRFTTGAS